MKLPRGVGLATMLLFVYSGCGYLGFELQDSLEGDNQVEYRPVPTAPVASPPTPEISETDENIGLSCALGTVAHCGACDSACTAADYPQVQEMLCQGNLCSIVTCNPGYADCDQVTANGCETPTNTVDNCGGCGITCSAENAELACNAGICEVARCIGLFGDCDGDVGNGCERPLSTLLDCGACNEPCAAFATETECNSGICNPVSCLPGFGDCDADPLGTGCETALDSLADCGGCGQPCEVQSGTPSCAGGVCTNLLCDPGTADCDGDEASCEVMLTSLTDCGACGAPCGVGGRLPHANATCAMQTCQVAQCDMLYDNCDSLATNGCETPLNTLADCGACGIPCSAANGTASCDSGSCVVLNCNNGFGDCRNGVSDGCETALNTTSDCGACGRSCSGNEQCVSGACLGYEYNVSNFPEETLNTGQAPLVTFNCGTTRFNSSTLSFSNACGQATPAAVVVSQNSGEDLVILPIRTLTIPSGSTLRLEGSRPVVLAVAEDATIEGTIELSASGTTAGPGGNQSCSTSSGERGDGSSSAGGGGGGGGGFGERGGSGGYGDVNGNQGAGGQNRGNVNLVPLLGGCGGGYGGGCSNGRGAGAGAMQMSVGGHLRLLGAIYANGSNGSSGCGSEGGGAGGGAGGGILLEAQRLTVTGTARANGGNGGNGGGGGSGGSGGTSTRSAQNGGSHHSNGGGGGGGAVGRIFLRGIDSCSLGGANFSPNPTTNCP